MIDEYAMIVRSWDWFNPIIPPVSALSAANIVSILLLFMKEKLRSINGPTFCHVDKISAVIHDTELITEMYHIWHGNIPIFITNASIIIVFIEIFIES